MTKKTVLKLILFIAGFLVVERFCYDKTEGFRLYKIASDLPYHAEWDTGIPSAEELKKLNALFERPFYFLGCGGQSYAFCSQDQSTVIKFFKHHHMRPKTWLDSIALPEILDRPRRKLLKKRQKRLAGIFNSSKLAHDKLKEETGIIYLHLNKTDLFNKKITIVDKLGIAHPIDIDKTEFVLQKKAELLYPRIDALMKQKDLEAAKHCLDSLLNLMVTRSKKGILDNDAILSRNFGVVDGDRAIEIDIGSFLRKDKLKSPAVLKKTFLIETIRLQRYVKKKYPKLLDHLYERIEAILREESPQN